ncbi:unnamed protein product [Peniophora sp. CBMAI 1063]|nr:unnamed protein product [Peniophora sp. CBMAI 1063]
MESLLPLTLIEPILSLITGSNAFNASNLLNTTALAGNGTTGTMEMPKDVAGLIAFVSSSKALFDYLKIIILGAMLEMLRRLWSSLSSFSIFDRFTLTASFDSEDISYDWMMYWLSTRPNWKSFREYSVSTHTFGLENNGVELNDEDEEEDDPTGPLRKRTRKVHYLPAYATGYRFWYKGRLVWLWRAKEENSSRWGSDKSTLILNILGTNRQVLDSLIKDAKETWLSARKDKIDLYANESYGGDWRFVTSRPQRPMDSIVLDAGVKELILGDARDFLRSKSWYGDRGIPFRRGYLLWGVPGSGKTSIIHGLAGELGLDIYIVSLAKSGLDDSTLNQLISNLPERCIALMEDIDAAFSAGLSRDAKGTELEDPRSREARRRREELGEDDYDSDSSEAHGEKNNNSNGTQSRITLSGLLNALDGVSAQEGRLLFATTNRYSALDPALVRPGRMDLHVEFKLASAFQARELYKRFYLPSAIRKDDTTPSEKAPKTEDADDHESDSGFSGSPERKDEDLPLSSSQSASSAANFSVKGAHHSSRMPVLSVAQVERLATRFSEAIPEREFSMASLQGYLMNYKTQPSLAVEEAGAWVQQKREESERKERIEKARAARKAARKAKKEQASSTKKESEDTS